MILSTEALTAIRRPGRRQERRSIKTPSPSLGHPRRLGETSLCHLTLRREGLSKGQLIQKPGVRSQRVLPFFCSCSWPVPLWASAIHSRWAPGTPANDQELRTGVRKKKAVTFTKGYPEDSGLPHRSSPAGLQRPYP